MNGAIEVFNNILESVLTKVCIANHDNWNMKTHVILWAYIKTCKIFMGKFPLKLVYGQEAVMLMEYIILSQHIASTTDLIDEGAFKEILTQLLQLEKDRFIAGFH